MVIFKILVIVKMQSLQKIILYLHSLYISLIPYSKLSDTIVSVETKHIKTKSTGGLNMFRTKSSLIITLLLMIGLLAACGSDIQETENKSDGYSGLVNAAGSTALLPLADEAASAFMDKHVNVSVTVQGGGSGTGINQVASGAVNIGNSDLPSADKIEDKVLAKELIDHKVAGIAYGIIVNDDAGVDNLTVEQIQGIFSGKIKNWREVGGSDLEINVVNRPGSSGTRYAFQKTIMKNERISDSIGTNQDSNGAVEKAIQSTPGSVSYLAMSYLREANDSSLKTVRINEAEPTAENVANGSYPFWSYEYMVTKGEATGVVKGYLEFIKSEEFAEVVTKLGYIPMFMLEK